MSVVQSAESDTEHPLLGGGRVPLRAGDLIRALVCGYPARARAGKSMVALQAFVDDSASEVGDRRLFLAGYINGAEQWAAFSDAWDAELRKPPRLDYCKMAQAENLRDQFAGWNADERNAKVIALARVIRAHEPWSVHCSVSRRDYERILKPVVPFHLKNPYFSCFWGIIHVAARYHRSLGMAGVPPVDFVFDEQGGLGDDAAIWYRWLKDGQDQSIRDLLGATPIFRDDKQMVALQAADMLAWHLRRDHERGGVEGRPAMNLLLREHAGIHLDAPILEGMAKRVARIPGREVLQSKADWRGARQSLQSQVAAGAGPPNMGLARLRLSILMTRAKKALHKLRRRRQALRKRP